MKEINKRIYRDLIAKGWKLNQIDESDIFFLFDLLFGEEEDQLVHIDEISWL
jgi:hypothetical protein